MSTPDRDRRDELASLGALGIATSAEQAELASLAAGDPAAAADARVLRDVVAAIGGSVPQVDPSPALRARVLASVAGDTATSALTGRRELATVTSMPRARVAPALAWLAAAASIAAAVGLGAWAWRLQDRVRELDARLAAAQEEVVTLTRTLGVAQQETTLLRAQAAVLVAPDLLRVDLAGQPTAPGASARAYWSRRSGMVFAAASLPPLPANKSYQVWVIADRQPPISAGVVSLGDLTGEGNVLRLFATPPDLPTPTVVAVTLEPEGGVPQPTGDKVLVGLTGL